MTFEERLSTAVDIIYWSTCEHSPYFSSRTVPEMYKPLIKSYVNHNMDVIDKTSFYSTQYRDNELIACIQVSTNDNVNRKVCYYNYSWIADDGRKIHVIIIPNPYRYNKVPHMAYNGADTLMQLLKNLVDPNHYTEISINKINGTLELFNNICLFCITLIDRYVMESIGKEYKVGVGTKIMDTYYSSEFGKLPGTMVFDFASDFHNGVTSMSDLKEFHDCYNEYHKDLITRLADARS